MSEANLIGKQSCFTAMIPNFGESFHWDIMKIFVGTQTLFRDNADTN